MNLQIETFLTENPILAGRWCATLDDYEGEGHPIGYGATESAAIANLIEFLEDEL